MAGKIGEEFQHRYAAQVKELAAKSLSGGKLFVSWTLTVINPHILGLAETKDLSKFGIKHSNKIFRDSLLKLEYEGSPNFFTYMWAKKNLVGAKVLEVGLSHYAGFGGASILRDVPGINYLGIDINPNYIEKNVKLYGSDSIKFEIWDIKKFPWNDSYDTIIAFEFIEHPDHETDGAVLIEEMKKHCKCLITTEAGGGHILAPKVGLDKISFFVLENPEAKSGVYMGVDGILNDEEKQYIIRILDIQGLEQVSDNIYTLKG